jgi:hypothetical protein
VVRPFEQPRGFHKALEQSVLVFYIQELVSTYYILSHSPMTLVTIKIHSRHFAIYSTTIYKQKLVAHGQIEKYIGTYTTQLVFAIYHILVQTKIMERERKAQEAYTNISKPLLTPLSPLQVTV